jgi:hypothetical protein
MAQAVIRQPLTTAVRFDPRPVHVGFVRDEVAMGQVFPRILRFSEARVIPLRFYTHSFLYNRRYTI